MKQPNLLQKINQIFDKKQKSQLVLLGFMIFIGGFLETLGVSTMIPVVTVLLTPEKVQEYIDKYEDLNKKGELLGGYNYAHYQCESGCSIPVVVFNGGLCD